MTEQYQCLRNHSADPHFCVKLNKLQNANNLQGVSAELANNKANITFELEEESGKDTDKENEKIVKFIKILNCNYFNVVE